MKTRTIDTNILVRALTRDDSEQWQIVSRLAETYRFFVISTVMLETEWVLRRSFKFDRLKIAGLFRSMMAAETFVFDEPERISSAIGALENGMDFADAMHVSGTAPGETFITFDRHLVRRAEEHLPEASVELAS